MVPDRSSSTPGRETSRSHPGPQSVDRGDRGSLTNHDDAASQKWLATCVAVIRRQSETLTSRRVTR